MRVTTKLKAKRGSPAIDRAMRAHRWGGVRMHVRACVRVRACVLVWCEPEGRKGGRAAEGPGQAGKDTARHGKAGVGRADGRRAYRFSSTQ